MEGRREVKKPTKQLHCTYSYEGVRSEDVMKGYSSKAATSFHDKWQLRDLFMIYPCINF